MRKLEIKELLISMRTADNEEYINNLLGRIDQLEEEKLQSMIKDIGDDEKSIRDYLDQWLKRQKENNKHIVKHTQINKMFSYGVSDNCIHLHMFYELHKMISEMGISKTIDTVNLYLLDAIEKIKELKNNGFSKFEGRDSIYLISPILISKEINFLKTLDFKTHTYKKKDLKNKQFINEHEEAQLAVQTFGNDRNVGTATIGLDVINSDKWQEKRKKQVELINKNGVTLEDKELYK